MRAEGVRMRALGLRQELIGAARSRSVAGPTITACDAPT